MSNSIIPHLLNDTPPPIVENDEEIDDEFGDFGGPEDLSFDDESLPTTPKHIEIRNNSDKHIEIPVENRKDLNDNEEKSENHCNLEHSVLESIEIDEKLEVGVEKNETCPIDEKEEEEGESVCENVQEIDDFGEFCGSVQNIKLDFEKLDVEVTNEEEENVQEFDDFGEFCGNSSVHSSTEPVNENEEEDDGFSEFAAYSTESQSRPENFASFDDFTEEKTTNFDVKTFDDFEKIFKEIFPEISVKTDDDFSDFKQDDQIFEYLKEITETNALKYQWSNSVAQKNLLKNLNIDVRNLLYGPSWKSAVPIFAVNLCSTPLEPTKSDVGPSKKTENVDVQAVEFDWNTAGLVNPLESIEENVGKMDKNDTISVNSLNLQENHVTNENFDVDDDFGDFTSCQPKETEKKLEWYNIDRNMLPLRESHIVTSSNDSNVAPSPITSVDLRTNILNFDVDLLEKLDTSHPSIPVTTQKTTLPIDFQEFEVSEQLTNGIASEDEFTDFHSSKPTANVCLEPLRPEPVKTGSIAKIDWPEPGIDEAEINRIVMGCTRKEEQENQTSVVKKEEDEWTDFVSVKEPVKTSPDLTLSVLNLSNLRPVKLPTPMVLPNGTIHSPVRNQKIKNGAGFDDDEWGDFVSANPSNSMLNGVATSGYCANYRKRHQIQSVPEFDFVTPNSRNINK